MGCIQRLAIAIVLMLCIGDAARAQFDFNELYEWVYRPPRYDRKVGRLVGYYASPFVQYDALRKRTFVAGDAYDVHYSTNEGRTWMPMFDTLFWYLDFKNGLQIRRDGTYLWYGTIYHSTNYMNILSEDGGRTWRMAIVDTLRGPFGSRDEAQGFVIEPSFHAWLGYRARAVTPPHARGVWVTADNGRTFKRIPYAPDPLAPTRVMSPGDSLVATLHGRSWYVANVVHDTAFRPMDFGGIAVTDWSQVSNRLIIGYNDNGTIVKASDNSAVRQLPLLQVHGQPDSVGFLPIHIARPSPETLVMFDTRGGIAVYRSGWDAPQLVRRPDTTIPLTPVPLYGHNDTIFVYSYGLLAGRPERRARYVVVDLRSLAVRAVETDGPTQHFTGGAYPMRMIAPLSAERWLVHNINHPGIMKWTTDAGRTWRLWEATERIDFAPHTYGGIRQILPVGGGKPVLRTAQNAVLVPTTDGYNLAVEAAFAANLRRGRVSGDAVATSLRIGEQLDDGEPSVRVVYGDQPLVQYDDTSFVTTGGALLRWNMRGRFLDTVFRVQSTHFNRLDNGIWVLGGDSTWFSFNRGKEWVYISKAFPHRLNREGKDWPTAPVSASIASADGGTVLLGRRGMRKEFRGVVYDSIYGGLLRTTDNGNTWSQVDSIDHRSAVLSLARTRQGTLLCLSADVVHMPEGKAWRNGAVTHDWFYGRVHLHRSTDHGRTWRLVSLLRFDPVIRQVEPTIYVADEKVYIVQPNTGVFQSTDDGLRWQQLDLTSLAPTYGINDIWQPGDGYLHFATDSGYARMKLEHIDVVSVEQAIGEEGLPTMTYFEGRHQIDVLPLSDEPVELIVADMRGVVVYRSRHVDGMVHQLPELPSGVYVAAARTARGVTSMPLTITR
jgi:photosystem II stability/assembly factor-like uncharacterized protein